MDGGASGSAFSPLAFSGGSATIVPLRISEHRHDVRHRRHSIPKLLGKRLGLRRREARHNGLAVAPQARVANRRHLLAEPWTPCVVEIGLLAANRGLLHSEALVGKN